MEIIILALAGLAILILLLGTGIQEWQNYQKRQSRDRLRAKVYGNHPAGTGREV